ncbi:MAG: hypothetical protein KDA24_07935 [Deltaproteobacteria bacterium]|nr:hypothetical protein [Deltaproteobacteria bacterium]
MRTPLLLVGILALAARPAVAEPLCAASDVRLEERVATATETSCHALGWTRCALGYEVFLSHPEVMEHAAPWSDCGSQIQSIAEWGMLGLAPEGWPAAEVGVSDVGATLLETTNLDFLFDAEALARRPLESVVLSESTETSSSGATYLQRRLLLRDPFVGEIPALLLLPPGTGSVPAVVALPGHGEDPEAFRDLRMGQFFPEQGLALLIVGFRAWTRPEEDHRLSATFLCAGFSLAMVRAYEALVALRYLQASSRTCGQRLGVIGHSGGASTGNLLAWLEVNPAVAHVTDLQAEYLTSDELGMIDCETHPGLHAHWESVVWFDGAPRAILEVPYQFGGTMENEYPPDPEDPASTSLFMPFLLEHLTPTP